MDLQGSVLINIFAAPYTHPNDSIDMENREIYKAIKSVADELCSDGKTFLRADLAYELKKYGVAGDSSEVGSLVYDAYCFYGNDSNISIAFVTNNARTTIVADYKLNHCLEQGDMGDALAIAENELQATENSLDKLQDMIALNLGAALANGSSKAADWLTGTSGVKEVRGKASVMFDRYAKLVEAYRYAGDSVRGNISDFTSLRSDIEATYREYALRLIDLYGDSIKMVSPELFDFNQVEFLDVDQMLRQIELEYSKIQDKCGVLIAEIADSFRTSLQGSMSAYRSAAGSSKTLGLAMAGLGMLDHYMAASEKANRLRGDLQQLQTSVKHDATRIKADMGASDRDLQDAQRRRHTEVERLSSLCLAVDGLRLPLDDGRPVWRGQRAPARRGAQGTAPPDEVCRDGDERPSAEHRRVSVAGRRAHHHAGGEAPQLSGRQTAQALEALLPAQLADAGHGPPQLLSQLFGVGRRLHPADQGV